MKAKKTILTALAAAAIAVGAQAQTRKVAPAGQDYTIGNITSASGDNVTYKWFRDGVEIPNATGATYTVPANEANHNNVASSTLASGSAFQRAAYGIDCPGGAAMSNVITIYFCELMVNGVCWARANSDESGRINLNPYNLGTLFLWNGPATGYSPTSPAVGVPIVGWNAAPDYAATWTNGAPCPPGWRLPTVQDTRNLASMSQPVGGVWVEGGVRGIPSGVNGRLYGYNTDYCTMSNMSGCIFLPANGRRTMGGTLEQSNPMYYWCNEHYSPAYGLIFGGGINLKAYALAIRCVQDVN